MIKKTICILISALLVSSLLIGCSSAQNSQETWEETDTVAETDAQIKETVAELSDDYTTIELNTIEKDDGQYSHSATINGTEVKEYDYTWNVDPAGTYEEITDAPAEYYSGTKPEDDDVYIAHDIFYYPQIDSSKFEKVNYDGETEWVTYYQSDLYKGFIFGTLPVKGNNVPESMMHTAEEAYENAVLHIEQAGTYKLTGDWHGQVYIDLGEDAKDDPDAVVTLILDNANIECSVAPGVIFKEVYECDNKWEDRNEYSSTVDTSDAGANIIIADQSTNIINGTNIFRMLKTKLKDDESVDAVPVQKKIRKNDGALYSYMSMNIYGESDNSGVLNVFSGNEGIDSELHLTVNGGNINIYSQDDGINTNEDGVSVTTINGGDIRIVAGLGYEGDGIDSNGYVVINGGKLISLASPQADSGLDSDCGTYINGGEVLALGASMDWAESDDSIASDAVTMNLQFSETQNSNEAIEIMDADGKLIFSYNQAEDTQVSDHQRYFTGAIISCESLKVGSTYSIWIGGKQQAYSGNVLGGFGGGRPPQHIEGETPPELPQGMELPEGTDGKQPPHGFDGKEPPQGFEGKEPPLGFDGKKPPQGFEGQEPPTKDQPVTDTMSLNPDFVMNDKVNNFGGVQDF